MMYLGPFYPDENTRAEEMLLAKKYLGHETYPAYEYSDIATREKFVVFLTYDGDKFAHSCSRSASGVWYYTTQAGHKQVIYSEGPKPNDG